MSTAAAGARGLSISPEVEAALAEAPAGRLLEWVVRAGSVGTADELLIG